MARLLRLNLAGAWYHVSARGNERKAIYRAERDRKHFLELLPLWCERFRLRLHAYVLMDNHYHFLLQTTEANLSQAMQWLNVSYTVWFNRRYQRAGHLLQGRFKAVMVEPDTWALSLSRYIHLNPVRVQRLGLDKAAQRGRRQGLGEPAWPEVIQARLELLRRCGRYGSGSQSPFGASAQLRASSPGRGRDEKRMLGGLSGATRGLGKGFGVVFGSGAWRAQPGGIGPSSRCGQPDDGECGAEEISPAVESGQATAQTGSQSDRGIALNC